MSHRLSETAEEVTLAPAGPATASVIWMHGLGADGHDFVPLVPELRFAANESTRFIFPHAPVRPVTLNNGMPMRAWYDIRALTREGRADEEGMRSSAARIEGYVRQEIESGVPANRIIIAGFSQGGAVALHVAPRFPERLGGILALSTYLVLVPKLAAEKSPANQDLPIFMCHGLYDPVLPLEFGAHSRDALRAEGYAVEWKQYPMQHQVCLPEIQDIATWLAARLPA